MTNNNKKRSSSAKMTALVTDQQGVGGRQTQPHPPSGGGGYQDVCTQPVFLKNFSKKNEDPRIVELREIGLGHKWLQIAEAIGFDAFMAMWSILDSENINSSYCDRVRVWVPGFRRYLRYQRNRYILARAVDSDADTRSIQKEIKNMLGESLTLDHIKRIMNKANIKE